MSLELEYRQNLIYNIAIFVFFYVTGYFLVFLVLAVFVIAPLEELDPEEVEHEDELLPFLENTYLETDWIKGAAIIKRQIETDYEKLDFEPVETAIKKNFKNEIINREVAVLELLYLNLGEAEFKKNDIICLNDTLVMQK